MTAGRRTLWFRLAAGLIAPLLLLTVELGLRLLGQPPPEPQDVFLAKRYQPRFSPFTSENGWVGIRPDWVLNDNQIRHEVGAEAGRFFLVPGFRPSRFQAAKPAGTVRIFTFGGSSTFGLLAAGSPFTKILRERLPEALGSPVEVVNLGCPGWAGDRVATLLRETLAFDPDLLVVYSGHNEYLGLKDDPRHQPGPLARLRVRLWSASRTFAWLNHALTAGKTQTQTLTEEEYAALKRGLIPVFDPANLPRKSRVSLSSEERTAIENAYARNLEEAGRQVVGAGVGLLFVMPVSNLLARPHLSARDLEMSRDPRFQSLVSQARTLVKSGQVSAGLTPMNQAIALVDSDPMIYYWRATANARLGQDARALIDYRTARDLDARPH